MIISPHFFEREDGMERGYDPYSRLLMDRVVLLFDQVSDDLACSIIAQLLFLEASDPEKEIYLYINSPGGSVSAGLAIYDTIKKIRCPVVTICVGMAASMGAFLLSAGEKGKRKALANSQIMIHQVLLSGTFYGQASDIAIESQHMQRLKERLNTLMAKNTGHTLEEITEATDRNNWMFAEDALAFGLIDEIIDNEG